MPLGAHDRLGWPVPGTRIPNPSAIVVVVQVTPPSWLKPSASPLAALLSETITISCGLSGLMATTAEDWFPGRRMASVNGPGPA